MQIKVEESDGIKKYFVNGKQYDRLEDIPEEFKSYFIDRNNNGIPDQFDPLFESIKKNPFSFKTLKSLVQSSPVQENQDQPINRLENGNGFLSTLLKIIVAIAVVLVVLFYFLSWQKKNTSATSHAFQSTQVVLTKSQVDSFEGTYLSGTKEKGLFWVEIAIKSKPQQNEYQINIKSKELKGYGCCELSKNGMLKNDTIFVQTTEWKRPVMMIITKNKSTKALAISAIEKQEDDRFALSYYCCGGKSLIGEYAKTL